jgi:hypothetical protein
LGGAKFLIASCLWVAASLTPVWASGPGEAPSGGNHVRGASAHPYPFFLSEGSDTSPVYLDLKGLRLAPLRIFSSPVMDGTDATLQGVKALYEMSLGNYSLEVSGGYVPGMKSLVPSETHFEPRAYLGYVNLKIPLYQFYLKGGAFFGQNMDALGFVFKYLSEQQDTERELFGYQFGGGYRFSDSLSVQAGWGQAAQKYATAREGLRAWYVQAQIILGWRMSVTPQVGFIDFTKGDGEKTREEAFYCGARWQISF